VQAVIRQGPDPLQYDFGPIHINRCRSRLIDPAAYLWRGKHRRDAKPEQASALGSGNQGVFGELHELSRSVLIRRFDEYSPDRVNAKSLTVLLLPLDEMVQGTHLAHHVRKVHRAAVGFVNEMRQFLPGRVVSTFIMKSLFFLAGNFSIVPFGPLSMRI